MEKITGLLDNLFGGGIIGKTLDKIFPDKAKKLEFEIEFRNVMFKELQTVYKDIADARDMQKEALKQSDTFSKRFVYFLSGAVLLNSIVAGVCAFFVTFPPENNDLVMMYYTFSFITSGTQVMRFFFGGAMPQSNTNTNINQFKQS